MHVFVIANEEQYKEFAGNYSGNDLKITRLNSLQAIQEVNGDDVVIDILFENTEERLNALKSTHAGLIIINSVVYTLVDTNKNFVRINGWNGFLDKDIIEASCHREEQKQQTEELFTSLGKQVKWLPDTPGFVSARVIAMIINEAHFAFDEQLSSREEIDVAMKLGTGYPYGPFEWAEKIGIQQVKLLLNKMAEGNQKYMPAIKD